MPTDDAGTDALERGNERIRDAAKWLVASAAAVGAAMLAGSQLSSIGELHFGAPDSVENARLWIAVLGAVAGLSAVVYAIWTAVQILLPKLVLVSDLDRAWAQRRSELAPVVDHFRRNPKYLQGFAAPTEVITAREQLVAAQREPSTGDDVRAQLAAGIADLDERITAIEDTATHEALKEQFRRALRKLMLATAVAALGIVAFAWAANPPAHQPTADLRNARLVDAYLRDVDLRDARLDHADLTNADLTGANLTGASINGVVWRNTTCPDGSNSDDNRHTCAGHLS
ncbi:pentapeptide repeat-containing protein [Micromonospora radicis]|nr:pentapeptide repeat-containing protein [Micromonospora radicis]